jgi:RNA polymerase sigma factor (sigma-70 family)
MVVQSTDALSGASGGVDVSSIRYIPTKRIRTKEAAEEAARVAERAALANGQSTTDTELEEQSLFTALHTCAYRATRSARRQPISDEERATWARRWKSVRDYIVEQNLGLAYSTIGRFHTNHPDWDELRSEAFYALVRAVEGFNPWRGFRFSTYACNAIIRALIQEARRAGRRRLRFPVGHDAWQEEPEPTDTWSELYVDRLNRVLELNLGDLTDRESTVLTRRFAMKGGEALTLGQVGRTLGLSKERVRQIQNRALGKIREVLEADPALQ